MKHFLNYITVSPHHTSMVKAYTASSNFFQSNISHFISSYWSNRLKYMLISENFCSIYCKLTEPNCLSSRMNKY
jgi:hypothetical protein